jgi:nucleoside-diphosphate-sugar epimerase
MQVLVTGATGVLGHRIVEQLADAGHEVCGLVRDEAGAAHVRDLGGEPVQGDVLEPQSLRDLPGAPVLVHAATAIPSEPKPGAAAWRYNDRVREEGLENVLDALGEAVEHVCFPSVVWVARQPDGSAFDESADRHPDPTVETVADVEDLLQAREAAGDFDTTILRCGFFYAHDAAHTRSFGEGTIGRRMPILGRGLLGRQDARLSFVHPRDAAAAFVTAIEAEVTGVYHVVDDEPVTFARFLRTLAEKLDAPEPFRMPAWIARPLLGRNSTRLLTEPMPTTNERFRAATDWAPTQQTVEEGLEAIVDRWEVEGTLEATEDGYTWTEE